MSIIVGYYQIDSNIVELVVFIGCALLLFLSEALRACRRVVVVIGVA